jgi:hypothetical protein
LERRRASLRKAGKQESLLEIRRREASLALNSLYRQRHRREIQNQAVGETGCFEVTSHDREMDILESFNRFQFDYDFLVDEKVESVLTDLVIAIEERHRMLTNESNPAQCKLDCNRLFINRFDETRSKLRMDRDRGGNDFPCDF